MPDVRYICLSDTHLGSDTSLLTALDRDGRVDPTRPSEPLSCLAACLRSLVAANEGPEKPALVLNGDVLELALSTTNVAVMSFQRALEQLLPRGESPFISRLVYLPGNHDHHVWQAAREQQYCAEVRRAPAGPLPHVPHATALLGTAPMRSALLDAVVEGLGPQRAVPVDVLYPNLALRSEDGRRLVVIHHGHFLEPLYSAMSRLQGALFPGRPPAVTVEELEADNGAWIDFFWSSLGNSGDVGADVELLYEKLQSPEQVQALLANLARALARQNRNALVAGLESFAFTHLLLPLAAPLLNLFRAQTAQELSDEERQGLLQYVLGPLRNQALAELGGLPPSVAFAFGHTHRAFAREIPVPGLGQPLQVFNTGGWVVDSQRTQPLNGASVLLVDETLEVAGIRLYAEADRLEDYPYQVSVFGLAGPDGRPGPFQRRVAEVVQRSISLWRAFSRSAGPAVAERRALLDANVRRAG
ncbi:MAG TPA: hypothetical protein VND93_32565 [Myxococcales bacterium]|nr:hypothetical protein [Myxococcales bacterium]